MFNRFFAVKLGIFRFSSEGLIKQSRKDDILEEISIPIIDLNQYPYIRGPVINNQLTVNLSRQEGSTKKKELELDESACINLDVIHEVGFIGNFIPPPSNYIEDVLKPEKATLDDFKLVSKRLKRIRIVYEEFFGTVGTIFSWKYPVVSRTCLIIYIIVAVFLPAQLALPLIIFLILSFCFVLSPYCKNFRKNFQKKYLGKKEKGKTIIVKTQKETDFEFKREFQNFNEKDKEGVLDTLKKIRVDIDELQEILMEIVSIAEKLRTLFMWEDPQKSLYFCIGLIIVVYLVYSIPFRLLVLIIGVLKFLDGKKTALKIHKLNQELCAQVLSSIFTIHLSDYYLQVDTERPWSQDLLKNVSLQKKIIKSINSKLALNIDTDIFQFCDSPKKLFDSLSSIEVLLKLRTQDGHIAERSKNHSTNPIKGFISNIPSEYYRFVHPRVKNIQASS